jgi:hypothetical protein
MPRITCLRVRAEELCAAFSRQPHERLGQGADLREEMRAKIATILLGSGRSNLVFKFTSMVFLARLKSAASEAQSHDDQVLLCRQGRPPRSMGISARPSTSAYPSRYDFPTSFLAELRECHNYWKKWPLRVTAPINKP